MWAARHQERSKPRACQGLSATLPRPGAWTAYPARLTEGVSVGEPPGSSNFRNTAQSRLAYDSLVISSSSVSSSQAVWLQDHDHSPAWGFKGHGLIQEVAVENLPKDTVPDFFTDSKERIVGLASQPDRWKPQQLGYLRGATALDHFCAYEKVKDVELPADRYDFVAKVQQEGLGLPGAPAKFVGFLPYRMAEMFQNLTLDFAVWRKEGQNLAANDPKRQALEQNVLVSAGLLGHYVEDAAQPLHASVHHDGWNTAAVGGNPHGYRTRRGFHREFETELVNAQVREEEVQKRVAPVHKLEGDPLKWGMGIVAESNAHVEELYILEKNGELKASSPSDRAVDFMHDRMAVGAQNLRDIWYTAWVESEKLARSIGHPE